MKKFFDTAAKKLCISLYVISLAICCFVGSPFIIDLIVETVGGTSKAGWYLYMPRLVRTVFFDCTVVFGICYSRLVSSRIKNYWHSNFEYFRTKLKSKEIINKRNGIILLILFAVSLIGFFALLRADVNYIDDIRHNTSTHYEWLNKGRIGIILSNLFIQTGYTLGDRSPINQLIAILCLDLSAIILAYVFSKLFNKEKIKILSVVASSIVIFNPYFLQCLSYKYESAGMGISVLLAVFPFLVLEKKKSFYCLSAISIFLMCTFYQSSNTIFILLVLCIGFIVYCLDNRIRVKEIIEFYFKSAVSFIIGMVSFYLLIANLSFNGPDRENGDFAFGSNIINNTKQYIVTVFNDFPVWWEILILLLVAASFVSIVLLSKRSKIQTFCLYLLTLLVSVIFANGAFVILKDFGDRARYLYGGITLIALIANIAVMSNKIVLSLPACLLAWSFFSYASAYGNALGFDSEYTDFMEKQVLSDINEFFPADMYPELQIVFSGDTNNLLPVEYLIEEYPITERMITGFLHYDGVPISSFWAVRHFIYYDNTLSPAETNYEPNPDDGRLVVSKRYYDLYFHQPDIIQVVFKKL